MGVAYGVTPTNFLMWQDNDTRTTFVHTWREVLCMSETQHVYAWFGEDILVEMMRLSYFWEARAFYLKHDLCKVSKTLVNCTQYTSANINTCNVSMEERPRGDVSDGVSWWCRTYKGKKSLWTNSFPPSPSLLLKSGCWLSTGEGGSTQSQIWCRKQIWTKARPSIFINGCEMWALPN